MTREEILEWLRVRGANGYGGAVSVERVAELMEEFQAELLKLGIGRQRFVQRTGANKHFRNTLLLDGK